MTFLGGLVAIVLVLLGVMNLVAIHFAWSPFVPPNSDVVVPPNWAQDRIRNAIGYFVAALLVVVVTAGLTRLLIVRSRRETIREAQVRASISPREAAVARRVRVDSEAIAARVITGVVAAGMIASGAIAAVLTLDRPRWLLGLSILAIAVGAASALAAWRLRDGTQGKAMWIAALALMVTSVVVSDSFGTRFPNFPIS